MVEDVYEPLDLWRRELRDAHRKNVAERFEALVAESGVDEGENRRLVADVRTLERSLAREKSRLSSRTLLRNLVLALAILAALALAALAALCFRDGAAPDAPRAWAMVGCGLAAAALFGLHGKVLVPAVRALRESVAAPAQGLAAAKETKETTRLTEEYTLDLVLSGEEWKLTDVPEEMANVMMGNLTHAFDDLEELGKSIGVVIKCQREEIFDMMHRV